MKAAPAGPDPAPGRPDERMLGVAPVRRARWELMEEPPGRVVVDRPPPRRTGGLGGLMARISHRLSTPRIRLDDLGSFAWKRLDGATTVAQVGKAMRRELGEVAEPAEQRAATFVAQLHELELVLLPGFDPPEEVAAAVESGAGEPPAEGTAAP